MFPIKRRQLFIRPQVAYKYGKTDGYVIAHMEELGAAVSRIEKIDEGEGLNRTKNPKKKYSRNVIEILELILRYCSN